MRFAARARGRVLTSRLFPGSEVGHHVNTGLAAGTRENCVRPLASELLWTAYHERVVDGGALAGVAGDGVGVLDVTGEVVEVKAAVFSVVGLYLDSHTASVIAGDCRQRAVVDVEAAVVAAGDDPVAASPFAAFGEKHLPGHL